MLGDMPQRTDSVYFHFPGGKEELATEVAMVHVAAKETRR